MRRVVRQKPGFTLLEILVATGIFMVVMVVAVGVFTLTVSGTSTSEQMRLNAQTARFAFESMTRETRLARGLVYTAPGENIPRILVPPFEITSTVAPNCITPTSNNAVIRVYQAKEVGLTSTGQALYEINRRVYYRDSADKQLKLTTEQARFGDGTVTSVTAADLLAFIRANPPRGQELSALDNLRWRSVAAAQSLLSNNLVADQFRLVCGQSYPLSGQSTDELQKQPFIQLDLTVLNEKYNANREEEKHIKTTLRTMIVPRSFSGPNEVNQSGVQGVN